MPGRPWVQIIFRTRCEGEIGFFFFKFHTFCPGASRRMCLTWRNGFSNSCTYTLMICRYTLQRTERGKWRSFTVCVCEETSREVKGGIVILVVPKVTSEDKQEHRERRRRVNPRWPCCVYPGCPVAPPSLPTMPDLLPSNLLTVSQVRTFVDKENIS